MRIIANDGYKETKMEWKRKQPLIGLSDGISEPLVMTPDNVARTFVWSDQHFSHKHVISFSNRPYMSIPEMNETLVANYNDCVGDGDIGIWVGDVGFGSTTHLNELLERCNG